MRRGSKTLDGGISSEYLHFLNRPFNEFVRLANGQPSGKAVWRLPFTSAKKELTVLDWGKLEPEELSSPLVTAVGHLCNVD